MTVDASSNDDVSLRLMSRSLAAETDDRIRLIVGLQFLGGLSIIIARLVYGSVDNIIDPFIVLGAIAILAAALFSAIMAYDLWRCLPFSLLVGKFKVMDSVLDRNDAVLRLCLALMIFDIVICGTAMLISHGTLKSIYTPLALAIIAVGFTIRTPRIHILVITVLVLMMAGFVEVLHNAILTRNCEASILCPLQLPESGSSDSRERLAALTMILISVSLTVGGSVNALRRYDDKGTIQRVVYSLEHPNPKPMGRAILQGARMFTRDLGHRIPRLTLGDIHEDETLFEHAVVLSHPFTNEYRAWARITYFVIASHWIDDIFDYPELWSTDINNIPIEDLNSPRSCFRRSYHLTRIWKSARRRNRWHRRTIDRAISRIIMGATLQHASNYNRIQVIAKIYIKQVLDPEIEWPSKLIDFYRDAEHKEARWIILWGTAKTVLDLFDSNSQRFHPVVSELFSILYSPILIFQNVYKEAEVESFSNPFRKHVFNPDRAASDPSAYIDKLDPCFRIFESNIEYMHDVIRSQKYWRGRQKQLEDLLQLYGTWLPNEIVESYIRIVRLIKEVGNRD